MALFSANAEGATENLWLEYSPPPECPGVDHIERRIGEWLNGTLPSTDRLYVRATLTWTGSQWRTLVQVELDGAPSERQVDVETCIDGADFVALAVVLAVEPDNAQGPEPAAAPHPEPLESAPPPTPNEPEKPPRASEPTNAPRTPVRGFAGLGAFLRTGSLPEPRFGLALQGGLVWSHWLMRVEARAIPAAAFFPATAAATIDFSLYALDLAGCYSWQFGALALGPCLSLEGGAVVSDQAGDGPLREAVATPWFALTPGVEATLPLSQHLRLYGSAGVSVPLTQFRLELDDGSLAHQATVGGEGTLGGRFFF